MYINTRAKIANGMQIKKNAVRASPAPHNSTRIATGIPMIVRHRFKHKDNVPAIICIGSINSLPIVHLP